MDNIYINIIFNINSLNNEEYFWYEYFHNEYFSRNMRFDNNINNIDWNTYFNNDYYYYYNNSNDYLLNWIQQFINNNNNINNTITTEQYIENINSINEKLEECPICFESSSNYDIIKKCSHKFCNICLSKWLLDNGSTCPICRIELNI